MHKNDPKVKHKSKWYKLEVEDEVKFQTYSQNKKSKWFKVLEKNMLCSMILKSHVCYVMREIERKWFIYVLDIIHKNERKYSFALSQEQMVWLKSSERMTWI